MGVWNTNGMCELVVENIVELLKNTKIFHYVYFFWQRNDEVGSHLRVTWKWPEGILRAYYFLFIYLFVIWANGKLIDNSDRHSTRSLRDIMYMQNMCVFMHWYTDIGGGPNGIYVCTLSPQVSNCPPSGSSFA